ncbi:MAG: N-6 DNA methylase, partial [Candidatus Anstonellales archaeon]
RRIFGMHFTPIEIFNEYILPQIKSVLYKYTWIDLFCGEGNLILPILNLIPYQDRRLFFKEHILCYDISSDAVNKAINTAINYGIPEDLAKENIKVRDTLKDYPEINSKYPVFHITNPPYLYLGYIRKHKEASNKLIYFTGINRGYQDLYQIALINDLRHGINNMIYIIPSNFLFSDSGANKIRKDFLRHYKINSCYIFEKKIFNYTGTNVLIVNFERTNLVNSKIEFNAYKINSHIEKKKYVLYEINNFKPNNEYYDYIKNNFKKDHLNVKFYLNYTELEENKGSNKVILLNSKNYKHGVYTKETFYVNDALYKKITSNPLFVRTVDTGSLNGKAGLYLIYDEFGADGIFVKGQTYRTNPIQIFIEPEITKNESYKLMKLFNNILNNLRDKTGSDFMTTYRYADNPKYIRKYLGLKQVKEILTTISIKDLRNTQEAIEPSKHFY